MAGGGYGVMPGVGGAGASAATVAPYGSASGYYDPYSYYAQHQQYYEQLRRTNPAAYAEWYRTYYAQMQASQLQRDLLTSDGRESVHSGRSSTNDKERFNRTTPYVLHGAGLYNPEEYHRHYNNQSLPSAAAATVQSGGAGAVGGHLSMLDQSYLSELSASGQQPSSLPPMFHHQAPPQAYAPHHSQLHQLRASTSLAVDRSYHGDSVRQTAGGYFQPRLDQLDASAIKVETSTELSVMEPERLTPRKFPEIHPIVSLSAGLLISTKNRLTMNGMADTVKIFSLGYSDASKKLFHTYPGPLVKGVTHKKSVIEFCEDQLRQGPPYSGALALIKSRGNSINSLHSSSLAAGANRGSFTLLWNYIILLLRQNGTFVGTDISELLMKNKEEYPFEPSVHGASAIRSANISGRNSSLSVAAIEREADIREDAESGDEPATAEAIESVSEGPKQLSELEITDKFRSYLIYGNISEALEWATEHNLWGHALFLASKVDSRQHANVMMKFANKLTLNDPLQTLYQLLSGRTPASVTSVLDEKWGDWRPHLAMLMSNSSAKPELIKKSITTLGDTLFNRGDLYAAHFCYLLSDVAFGRFADVKPEFGAGGATSAATTVRLVLLGASHHQRNFRELSTNESIMMTEIYEYARSLNEDRYSITELQRFKYLLACRMLDQGMQLKCLLYMEQIAEQIQNDPYRFETDFVRKVYTLGDRLKYYDPVMEKALDESVDNTGRGNIYAKVEDPAWLQRLQEIIHSNNQQSAEHAANYNSNIQEAAYDYNNYGYGVEQSAVGPLTEAHEQSSGSGYPVETNDINKQFNEINQQLGQLNLQYNDQQHEQPQQQQPSNAPVSVPSYDQGYESINPPSLMEPSYDQTPSQMHPSQPQDNNSYEHQQQQQQHEQFNHYNPYEQQQAGAGSIFTPAPAAINSDPTASGTGYDGGYWGAAGGGEVPKPTISMPNSVSNRPGFNDEADNATGGAGHQQQGHGNNAAAQKPGQAGNAATQSKKPAATKDSKSGAGGGAGGAQGSGWFGGIWNKFSMKPKNQMILPDDKNPKIVWDEVSKRWVNTDETEAEQEAYKPPPKMTDLMPSGPSAATAPSMPPGAAQAPSQETNPMYQPVVNQSPSGGPTMQAPATAGQSNPAAGNPMPTGEPMKVPNLQSNMYKMQRNRTLKRSYVDVFNPSGAAPKGPQEQVLAPSVPTLPTAATGFFVPGGAAPGGQQTNDAPEGMPQFYNPNQFAGAGYQQ
uniref:Putative sec23-binding domain of sec16 n=1 Tax=Anopheles triannulatus TaxID=58253 RepID=A0A2M4A303_9DIPT